MSANQLSNRKRRNILQRIERMLHNPSTSGLVLLCIFMCFLAVDSRPSSSSSSSSSSPSRSRHSVPEAPPEPFCTLENFQNCLNVDLFHSKINTNKPSKEAPKKPEVNQNSSKDQSTSGLSHSQGNSQTDLAFPTSIDELSMTCKDLKERVKCLDEHSERCFTNTMMQVFGHIVTNAKQFVYDLCDNRQIQSEFLVHAKCFRNISLDEQKCGLEYKDAIGIPSAEPLTGSGGHRAEPQPRFEAWTDPAMAEWLPNPAKLVQAGQEAARTANDAQLKELFMRRSCCALQELVLCKRRHVREQCGEAASIFMRDHLPRITNPVLEQHCSAFTYGPGTCDEALHRRRIIDGQLVQVQPVMFHQQNRDSPLDTTSGEDSSASMCKINVAVVSGILVVFSLLL